MFIIKVEQLKSNWNKTFLNWMNLIIRSSLHWVVFLSMLVGFIPCEAFKHYHGKILCCMKRKPKLKRKLPMETTSRHKLEELKFENIFNLKINQSQIRPKSWELYFWIKLNNKNLILKLTRPVFNELVQYIESRAPNI